MEKSEQSTEIPLSWERILHMLVLGAAYTIAETILIALIIGQILFRVVSKEANEPIRRLSKQLSGYLYEIMLYLSFNSDQKPFSLSILGRSVRRPENPQPLAQPSISYYSVRSATSPDGFRGVGPVQPVHRSVAANEISAGRCRPEYCANDGSRPAREHRTELPFGRWIRRNVAPFDTE